MELYMRLSRTHYWTARGRNQPGNNKTDTETLQTQPIAVNGALSLNQLYAGGSRTSRGTHYFTSRALQSLSLRGEETNLEVCNRTEPTQTARRLPMLSNGAGRTGGGRREVLANGRETNRQARVRGSLAFYSNFISQQNFPKNPTSFQQHP